MAFFMCDDIKFEGKNVKFYDELRGFFILAPNKILYEKNISISSTFIDLKL